MRSDMPAMAPNTPPPFPHFLTSLHASEIKGADPTIPQAIILAVHSVFLESGFIAFDPALNTDGVRLPKGWASALAFSTVRIRYTLPPLLNLERNSAAESVVLNFQFLGNSVVVYGCLSQSGSKPVRLFLDASRFAPSIGVLLRNGENGGLEAAHERAVVFEFWKTVKDGLSLPLLITICDAVGWPSPPCFMVLPIDVKFRIFEFLPGIDVARAACVCSELRCLASNDQLWRRKFVVEFCDFFPDKSLAGRWKQVFAAHWKRRECEFRRPLGVRFFPSTPLGPVPFGAPGSLVFGGDYDWPVGPFYLHGPRRNLPRFFARQQIGPHCNLGGFDI
ncbi:hypothetical protein ACLOJK_036062 [Asimina triloba]